MAEYLAAQWLSTTETLWQGILRLDAAHTMVVTLSGPALSRYWAPDLQASLSFRSDQECAEHYRALLFDVVRRLSRSIHPIACEVSGGLDSSAIFAVAETLRRHGQLAAPALEGYTLDFSGDPDADEIDYCRAVGAHLGQAIHEITPARVPLSWYQDVAQQYQDFPDFPNGGAMGLPIAERARADGARVLLNGLGGDQWLCGSEACYAEAIAGRRGRELLNILGDDINAAGLRTTLWRLLRHGIVPLLSEAGPADAPRRATSGCGDPATQADQQAWLAEPMRARIQARQQVYRRLLSSKVQRVGQSHQLACLYDAYQMLAIEMAERHYAQVGLEMRQPFWNARMVEFALATPERSRLRGNQDKWLHRRAMQGLLPDDVLRRSSKAEFSVTFSRYLTDLAPHMTETVGRRRAWVKPQPVRSMSAGS